MLADFKEMILFTGQPGADHMTPILNWNMTLVDLNMWFENYTAELSLYRPEETHRYRRDLYEMYSRTTDDGKIATHNAAKRPRIDH